MATYPVINTKTGEQKDVVLSVHEWDQWKEDNPEWTRDWSDPSTCPASGEVGDWIDKMGKTHPGWTDIMKNKIAPQAAVKGNKSITDKYR
jgi:hypothetical protein